MENDPVLAEADAWFKKLSDPSTPTFRLVLAHAWYSPGSSPPLNQAAVSEKYRKTSDQRMERLVDAVKTMGGEE